MLWGGLFNLPLASREHGFLVSLWVLAHLLKALFSSAYVHIYICRHIYMDTCIRMLPRLEEAETGDRCIDILGFNIRIDLVGGLCMHSLYYQRHPGTP